MFADTQALSVVVALAVTNPFRALGRLNSRKKG